VKSIPANPRKFEFRTKLLLIFGIWWLFWAYKPWFFSDWVIENLLTVACIAFLYVTRNSFRLSNLSYFLLFAFLCLHTIGSHYTYAEVPYERWSAALGFSINELFGFSRNHFDRLVHFLFGFLLAYPFREMFMRVAGAKGAWSYYLPVEIIMSFSMIYEIIEWLVAEIVGGDLGMAYLGIQGDIWDAHKDMGLATLGAALGMTIVALVNRHYHRDFGREFLDSLKVKDKVPLGEVKLQELKELKNKEEKGLT
jgi:putative membrane protein